MSEFKGTAGDWTAERTELEAGVHAEVHSFSAGRAIAAVYVQHDGEDEANLRLFLAAPDMLAVLDSLMMDLNGVHCTLRAASTGYRTLPVCGKLDNLIAMAAAARSKALGQ